jgi:signal transduction histidine kinase
MAELIDIARYAASENNIKIESHISEEIPDYIAYDRIKMNQVMTNLINNAVKFSKPDSIIVIRLDKETDKWRISIKDQGTGITPSKLPYIFDLFATAKDRGNNTEGMGVGLYIVRQLVTALQGEISVKSDENAGSCFTVELPIIPFELLNEMTFCPG